MVGRKYFLLFYTEIHLIIITIEFQNFTTDFHNLHTKIKSEHPFAVFYTGDFNSHSQAWWPLGDSTLEGTDLDDLFTKLGLFQLISEPTNFEPNKTPTCIDLILTDQPNIVLDCRTRASLDHFCHY